MTDVAEAFGSSAAAQVAVDRAVPTLGDFCLLVGVEGTEVSDLAAAHIHPEGLALLQSLLRRNPPSLNGPGFASHALREQESLLIPDVDDDAARYYGIEGDYLKTSPRSASAARWRRRSRVRGDDARNDGVRQLVPALRPGRPQVRRGVRAARRADPRERPALSAGRGGDQGPRRVPVARLARAAHAAHLPRPVRAVDRPRGDRPAGGRSLASLGQGMVRQAGRLDRLADRLLSASEIGDHAAHDQPGKDRPVRAGARPDPRLLERRGRRGIDADLPRRRPGGRLRRSRPGWSRCSET